ncbi:hypothetical protein QR680_003269 [Steinernema hermaphroditum]|uniref:Uncharacterized protein n=1 Tax=Steinernema hermaphroditum TaxID=289476 RepID=A0AA39H878_9BILA|nr:hypothetical protein QR680_003269 [Steinernema hermaphroditum]
MPTFNDILTILREQAQDREDAASEIGSAAVAPSEPGTEADFAEDEPGPSTSYQANAKRREQRRGCAANPKWQSLLNQKIESYLAKEESNGNEWSSEELYELYKLICKYGCCHEAVSHVFSERLAPRSLDDIRSKIVEIHDIIEKTTDEHKRLEYRRCNREDAVIEPPLQDTKVNTWLQAVWELLSHRHISDESNMAVVDVMQKCQAAEGGQKRKLQPVPITNSADAKCRKIAANPDYASIYKTVEMMAAMRDPQKMKMRDVDAAVLVSAIAEVERHVDQHHVKQMPMFAALFRDLQSGHFEDYSILHQLNANIDPGSAHINFFGLTEEQRSVFASDSKKKKKTK